MPASCSSLPWVVDLAVQEQCKDEPDDLVSRWDPQILTFLFHAAGVLVSANIQVSKCRVPASPGQGLFWNVPSWRFFLSLRRIYVWSFGHGWVVRPVSKCFEAGEGWLQFEHANFVEVKIWTLWNISYYFISELLWDIPLTSNVGILNCFSPNFQIFIVGDVSGLDNHGIWNTSALELWT